MKTEMNCNHLNEQQLMMLRLLKNPFPEEYFQQLKQVAVNLLLQQLDDAMYNCDGYGKVRRSRAKPINNRE